MSTDLTSLGLALGIFMIGFISIGPNILTIIGSSMQRGCPQRWHWTWACSLPFPPSNSPLTGAER
ncbi:MAG: hypothetical protein P1U83_15090 [Roseovarius sp.]|nr:hypothetical protein [Roseovarius sp.]